MRFRVQNATRGRLLAEQAERADSFVRRLVGLMGRRALRTGEALHLVPCRAVHTFFMRIPVDVVFLDAQHRVVRLRCALPPWRATVAVPGARSVLELPAGTLAASGTRPGDQVVFEPGLC